QLDQAMLFSKKFHLEVFYEDGEVERREMEDVPIFASFFPTCESFSEEDYTVSVKEVFVKKGAQKENMLINSAVIEWEKDRKNHNPAETLTKIQFVIE
ncbi:MAG: hypothetical protein OXJ52_04850, partial [Oligoflexia bacterium]|nr:hypothetical protein [Oligoflexia bacterium]